ncbi:hypothetical protein BUALT_Bualt04G0164900 [Buddleja alternifolia]|uniref:Surfeit locus protein 2 n=1 Tax=Buddleja alternifolia TaxID=168488 RepID=A0AAV6XWA4_9LAMI|nr:hypothetical protein BUALT_Bualt04G0164900 [Buddleja alternifolia]
MLAMGKKKGEEKSMNSEEKEGRNLLGAPTFEQLENGRFKCVETGHELPAHTRDSYAQSKHCRLGLIDSAIARNKPPLNMFKQDPVSSSKLVCRLTGDTINKSEEHIWKHINGKRFLNMLVRDSGKSSDSENEDFWMPPAGERWDHDDGGDRWGSDSESGPESDDAVEEGIFVVPDAGAEESKHEAVELSKKAKRMSLEIGPSSFASRKKKKKTTVA